jgi:hypothetical protein
MDQPNMHPDVSFSVLGPGGRHKRFSNFDSAAGYVVLGALQSGTWTNIYVYVTSELGARWWRGKEGVQAYLANPNAEFFEILTLKVNSQGLTL